MTLKISDRVWFDSEGPTEQGTVVDVDTVRRAPYKVDWDNGVGSGWFTREQLHLVGSPDN